MKTSVVLAASLLWAAPASAQFFQQQIPKVAVSGKPVILNFVYNTSPDCTGDGYAEIRITEQPLNGRVDVTKASDFPSFPPSNVRQVCNSRRVPGIQVRYTSRAGFVGSDVVGMESIFPRGASLSRRYAITVK
jgi:hypothetical protein